MLPVIVPRRRGTLHIVPVIGYQTRTRFVTHSRDIGGIMLTGIKKKQAINEKGAPSVFQTEVLMYLVKRDRIPLEKINIISQYNAQRSLIKEMLEKKSGADRNLKDPRVQTVVASQGRCHLDLCNMKERLGSDHFLPTKSHNIFCTLNFSICHFKQSNDNC